MEREYLGDAVSAEMCERSIKLVTNDGVEDTNTIYLEPEVWDALLAFVQRQYARIEASAGGKNA